MWLKVLLLLGILAIAIGGDISDDRKYYKGYKLYHVDTERESKKQQADIDELNRMCKLRILFRNKNFSSILVGPTVQADFEKELHLRQLPFRITIDDMEEHFKRLDQMTPIQCSFNIMKNI